MKKSQLVSIIAEQLTAGLKENVQTLKIAKYTSDEGNNQIGLTIQGSGISQDDEIKLSTEEAKALHELCKSFVGERQTFSKAVNTEDQNSTQSIIKIEASGLKCIISRQEGSIYKGYDEQSGSNTGYFVANQSIAYQIVDRLDSFVARGGRPALKLPSPSSAGNKAGTPPIVKLPNTVKPKGVPSPPPPPPPALPKKGFLQRLFREEAPAVPTDVTNLAKAQGAATSVALRAKNINNPQEFPGAFKAWFETLGYEPGKIGRGVVRASVDKVLTDLGYK